MSDNTLVGEHIEYMPLAKLIRAYSNPKDHDLGEIINSIRRFGFTQPMIVNEATGRIVSGHGRLEALQYMKVRGEKLPRRIIEKDGEWYVPVIRGVSFDSEEEADAYLIADNRLVEIGGWDDDELARHLSDLAARGEDMLKGVGFDMDDVDEMIKRMGDKDGLNEGESEDGDESEDEPELPPAEQLQEKWQVERGDVWTLGGEHWLLAADCTNVKLWEYTLNQLGQPLVNGIVTSPPYAKQRASKDDWYGGVDEDVYVEWFAPISQVLMNHLDTDGSFFLNIKPNVREGQRVLYVFDLVLELVRKHGWRLVDEFCWERISAPGSWPNRFKNGFEPVYHFARSSNIKFYPKDVAINNSGVYYADNNKNTGSYYHTVEHTITWETSLPSNRIPSYGNASALGHPAAFPVGLPTFFIRAFSEAGDVWADPFSGSGTTSLAALRQHRRSIGFELDPKYVAIALERLEMETGETPERMEKVDA